MNKKFIINVLVIILLFGCSHPIEPPFIGPYSTVTFLKNTFNEPILVQSYYRPFINDSTLWCEKEPIAWSEPIIILPNEYQLIMDYVKPDRVKIFNIDSTLIVDVQYGWSGSVDLGKVFLRYELEDETIGVKLYPENKYAYTGYYLQDARYAADNVPWNIYPIYYDMESCNSTNYNPNIDWESAEGLQWRKDRYKEEIDGYAVIHFLTFNREASCFAQE